MEFDTAGTPTMCEINSKTKTHALQFELDLLELFLEHFRLEIYSLC